MYILLYNWVGGGGGGGGESLTYMFTSWTEINVKK